MTRDIAEKMLPFVREYFNKLMELTIEPEDDDFLLKANKVFKELDLLEDKAKSDTRLNTAYRAVVCTMINADKDNLGIAVDYYLDHRQEQQEE